MPAPLGALLVAIAILGVTWALLVPPWQSPDEPQHFAYAQSLATRFALPGDKHRQPFSSAQTLADSSVGASAGAFYPVAAPPSWTAAAHAAYQAALRRHPSAANGGGPNSATANPPLFYLYADIAYWLSGGGSNAFDQLYAMRIWDVVLLLATVTGAWLLAGEVFGRRRPAQLVCAAVAGMVPAETFISTSMNPDALMIALWAVAFWLGARVINRGLPRRDGLLLGAVTAAAVLTKATSYALVPAAGLALLLGWLRRPQSERGRFVVALAPPFAVLVAPILAWLAAAAALNRPAINTVQSGAHAFNIRQFLSYVWQFYLPKPSFLTSFRETAGLPLYQLWVKEGWGVFGWRNIGLPPWTYMLLGIASGVVAIGSAVVVIPRLRSRRNLALMAFFAVATVTLLAGLHVTDYRALIAGQAAVIQGRYLLPLLPLFGVAVAAVVTRVPRSWQGTAAGVILASLLLLQVLALSTVARAYYA